ncbi:MAG: hypothetical protein HY760_00900 [Nitrospirae bacterium]|nr:hypothetical protein [Nitrospirota bacterium]
MKPILHIVKDADDHKAIEVIAAQAKDNAYGVAVILVQGAVPLPPIPGARTCALKDETGDRPIAPGVEPIGYPEMLSLVFSSEAVTAW